MFQGMLDCGGELLSPPRTPIILDPAKLSPMDSWTVELPVDIGTAPHRLVLTAAVEVHGRKKNADDIKRGRWQLESQAGTSYPIPGRFVAEMFLKADSRTNIFSLTTALFTAAENPDLVQILLTRKYADPNAGLFLFTLDIFLINAFVHDLIFSKTATEGQNKKLCNVLPLVREHPLLQPLSNFSEPPLTEQLDGFKLELWDWQKRNVSFLRRIEGSRANQVLQVCGEDLDRPSVIRVTGTQISICPTDGKIKLVDSAKKRKDGVQLECRGGIFCDPTSTGKSITMIASIWKQKLDASSFYNYFEDELPIKEQSKFFQSRATLIICPTRLIKQWEAYFKLCLGDRAVIVEKRLPKQAEPNKLLIKTIATASEMARLDLPTLTRTIDVFLVPLTLLVSPAYCRRYDSPHDLPGKAAYLAEFSRLNSLLRVKNLGLTTREEIRNQIANLEPDRVYVNTWHNSSLVRVANTVAKVRAALLREKEPIAPTDIKGMPLEAFFWQRIIVDEAHELIQATKRAEAVEALKAQYTWLLTATPNFNSSSGGHQACLPRLLNVQRAVISGKKKKPPEPVALGLHNEPWLMDKFLTAWCRRSGVIAKQPLTEHRIEVALTPQELALYHSYQNTCLAHLLQFCSYHTELQGNTSEDQTVFSVSQTAELLQKERRLRQEEVEKELRDFDEKIQRYWPQLKAQLREHAPGLLLLVPEPDANLTKFTNALSAEVRQSSDLHYKLAALGPLIAVLAGQKTATNSLASVIRQQAYYESILELLSNPNDIECVIHMGIIPREHTGLLVCGHYFCQGCLNACWAGRSENSLSCPACRHPIKPKRDMRIVDRRPPQPEPEKEPLTKEEVALTDRFGSKIKRLVELITNIRADASQGKILVFAQWDHLLKQIGEALKTLGIETACPRGNFSQINAAFNQFYTDDSMRVLLLSTRHNLSGSHLVEANNLIFVHPFPETPRSALREWEQAVSRMQRYGQTRNLHVWYMVTNNTVEVELTNHFLKFKTEEQAMLAKIESIVGEEDVAED